MFLQIVGVKSIEHWNVKNSLVYNNKLYLFVMFFLILFNF